MVDLAELLFRQLVEDCLEVAFQGGHELDSSPDQVEFEPVIHVNEDVALVDDPPAIELPRGPPAARATPGWRPRRRWTRRTTLRRGCGRHQARADLPAYRRAHGRRSAACPSGPPGPQPGPSQRHHVSPDVTAEGVVSHGNVLDHVHRTTQQILEFSDESGEVEQAPSWLEVDEKVEIAFVVLLASRYRSEYPDARGTTIGAHRKHVISARPQTVKRGGRVLRRRAIDQRPHDRLARKGHLLHRRCRLRRAVLRAPPDATGGSGSRKPIISRRSAPRLSSAGAPELGSGVRLPC